MTKKKQNFLIFMCWAMYVVSYIGRYSYNSNILPISKFYQVSDAEIGLVTSFFFFAYGAGQIVNGLLCKYYNVRYVLSLSLFVSAIINGIIFLGVVPFEYIKFLWMLNGIAQSVLWSSLLMTLSKNLDEKHIKKAIIVMSTTAALGTLISYGLSAILSVWGAFKYSFLTGCVLMIIFAIAWFIIYNKITVKDKVALISANEADEIKQPIKTDKSIYKILILFGIFAIVINFIKDGLATWVPKILFDTFALPESLSILLTLVVPILAVFGTVFVVSINKKVKDYLGVIALIFGTASILVGIIILLMTTSLWGFILLIFGLVSLLMSGANNVVTSIMPLSLRDKANSGFIGGILNGCCYVGSTLSSVGLGIMSDYYGEWLPVFYLLVSLSIFVTVLAVVVLVIKKISRVNKIKIN